ncbi:MAG: Ig-like domain-containing protein [Odoribacter sp.]|nr:Ig-like domain-containing protein [Odoribacter sp.]
MRSTFNTLAKGTIIAAMSLVATPAINAQDKIDWGEFKLFLDPGHSGTENRGLWGYSEAEKTLAVALNIKDFLETYTTAVDGETLQLCRYDQSTIVSLEERSDMANAWGADFYYSIHSDASGSVNSTLLLFGGWRKDGVEIEKTPNGGKAYGEILMPNLSGVMRVPSRGNKYDRCHYDPSPSTHTNQYPYLSVNRRSNMASLLSEGGYHDMAVQQQRNLNDDYKRLEAFAAFQSLMSYRGLELPAQTFVTGMITNSENLQPINGATIKIGEQEYTTDTYESLFNKYSRNPDLIHNGFFFFEGLEAGSTLPVTITAPGYEEWTGEITIKDGSKDGKESADYVTFLDVALTNAMPAVVSSVSAENLEDVSTLNPLTLTFSRNMDRQSVEDAFSISNNGEVELSWTNDYTLDINISKLRPYLTYVITLDGAVAKNSQTGAFIDGDGDGEAGGDYVLRITIAEPDTEAPYVYSTYPAEEGEALYTLRPAIRLEFNEEIQFNGDQHDGVIKVTDSKGNNYTGLLTHDIIAGNSVLHFFPAEDLPSDCAILVEYAGGIPDLSGNLSEEFAFRFLTEYRACTYTETVLALTNTDGMWAPGGSGSTTGIVNDESTISVISQGPAIDNRTSFAINYVFDIYNAGDNFLIRDHYPEGMKSQYRNYFDGVVTMWVYGDGSNNGVNLFLRSQPDGIKMRENYMTLDFRGWNLFVFDLQNSPVASFTGSKNSFEGETKWCLDAIAMNHERTDEDDEETPFQEWTGTVGFNGITFTRWDDQAERNAAITDVELPGKGIENITTDANAPVEYYNLQGMRVTNPSAGVYIRRQGNTVTKVFIK